MNVQGVEDGAAAAALAGVEQGERGGGLAPANARRAAARPAAAVGIGAPVLGAASANDAVADLVARLGGRAPVRSLDEALLQATGPARGGYAGATSRTTSAALTAAASRGTAASAKKTTSRSTSTAAAARKELAFLDDKTISIEEKLFRFLVLMQQKTDKDLVAAMKSYDEKKAAAAKSSGSSAPAAKSGDGGGGGGLFGLLGDAVGSLGKSVVSGAEGLAKDLGGPVLAAGATALGMPWLAPVALQIGGPLAAGAVDGVASLLGADAGKGTRSAASTPSRSTSTSGSHAASAATSGAGATDEVFDEKVEAMKLQQLVEKQTVLFNTVSNILKTMHDAQMNAIGNIR
ncbi:MAG: hypothetical protein ACJ79L_11380 [Anaeromyxobacteraceae bacterium]